jgi:ATP-dependent Lon protease
MYAATDDEESISEGVVRVKKILSENFVRPDEAEKSNLEFESKGNIQ